MSQNQTGPDIGLGLNEQGKVKLKTVSNDSLVLKQLCAQVSAPATPDDEKHELQNLSIAGQTAIPEGADAGLPARAVPPSAPIPAPLSPIATTAENLATFSEPAPVATNSDARPAKLFITGRTAALERLLSGLPENVTLVSLNRTASELLKATCLLKGEPPAPLVQAFRAWGDGNTAAAPYTVERLLLLGMIRREYPEFGTAGFWARLVLNQAGNYDVNNQWVMVGIQTPAEFKVLQDSGFIHFHAWTNTLAAPGDSAAALINSLDNDVSRKISTQRTGPPKLRVVWMDDPKRCPTPDRLFTPEDFRNEVVGIEPTVVNSALVI